MKANRTQSVRRTTPVMMEEMEGRTMMSVSIAACDGSVAPAPITNPGTYAILIGLLLPAVQKVAPVTK
jgi:hypothetical protein